MPRSTTSIDAEITALEARVVRLTASYAIDGQSKTLADIDGCRKRLDVLYHQKDSLDPATGRRRLFTRGEIG